MTAIKGTEIEADVEVRIRGLMMDPVTNMPMIVLKDVDSDSVLPIWVGIFEANAIAMEIEKASVPRPMTHDLLRNAIRALDAEIRKVVVSALKEDTFYGVIWLDRKGETLTLDARPSDALALALRHDCPIFVDDKILKNSTAAANVSEKANNEELRKWLENLNDEDMGRYKM